MIGASASSSTRGRLEANETAVTSKPSSESSSSTVGCFLFEGEVLAAREVDVGAGEGALHFLSRVVNSVAVVRDDTGAVDGGSRELEGDRVLRRADVALLLGEDCACAWEAKTLSLEALLPLVAASLRDEEGAVLRAGSGSRANTGLPPPPL